MFIIFTFYVVVVYIMPLNPEIWLPHLLFTLQTISMLYPQHPNDVTKKKYYDTIHNIPLFFPIKPIGSQFSKLLDKFPVTPYLSSRESFMRWIHFIINKINVSMEWEQNNFYDSLEKYYKAYKPKELLDQEKFKRRKQYIIIGVVAFLIITVLYMLKS